MKNGQSGKKNNAAKRVDIVSIKMVKEASFLYEERQITSPRLAVELLNNFYDDCDREKFIVLCLNTKNEPTVINVVSIGSLNAAIVHPREIFKIACLANSASIIICHNHPSGDPTPSKEDLAITKRLVEAGQILGIEIKDHVILGEGDNFISFKEKGLI